ncbi:MAG TPA: OmpA family protein [Candidatus Kapabacteria bacterium]|nr:OmpA family protein [Candidatus Kapabacteria bacterium]
MSRTFTDSLFAWCLLPVASMAIAVLPLAAQPRSTDRSGADTLENLGANINTVFRELCPVISPDGRTLYFQREVVPKVKGMERDFDIYSSTLRADGTWSEAVPLPAPLNTWAYNGLNSILPDGNTLFLDYRYNDDGSTERGFSISHRTADGWTKPTPIEIDDYVNTSEFANAYLCNDGRTLLLGIQADDTYGDLDLYVSFMQENGRFTKPTNLGHTVNTSEGESCPFLAADGQTLYFASKGHHGLGNYDIFMARRLDDTWHNWSEPVNLGAPINSPAFDAYYTISAAGDYAYLVSYKNSFGMADIFRVRLRQAVKPKPVVLISGKAFNSKTGKAISARIRYEFLPEGREAGVANSTPVEGYKLTLPGGAHYGVRGEAPGYYPINTNIDLSKVLEYREQSVDLFLVPIEVGSTIRLNNIFFEFGKATLMPESFPELNRVVQLMDQNPTMHIDIAGHTDNVGSDQSNMTLSMNRARAVVQYLTEKGVANDRLGWAGYGKSRPVASNETDEGRQQNRRVEFTVTSK